MSRLTALRRRGRDRGAVAALVAVLLSGNVLLGMAALTVDVGLLYVEREELQSGADAAVVAVAKVCAADITACIETAMVAKALSYAKKNAKDGAAAAAVCGRVLDPGSPGTSRLGDCPKSPGNLTACIGDAPAAGNYVEVRTSTRLPDGTTALPPAFAGAVTGTSGTTVAACSRVSWGPVHSGTVRPTLAMSICQFNKATDDGSRFQPRPTAPHQHGFTDLRFETVYHWHNATDRSCHSKGHQITEGFGWFTGAGFGNCNGTVRVGQWYTIVDDPRTPIACRARLRSAYQNSTPLAVAIIDDGDIPGHEGQVRVAGIAAFVITGWWTPPGWLNGPGEDHVADLHQNHRWLVDGCSFTNMCIYGYFTTRLVGNGTGPLGDPTYGTYYIKTIG